ncbi:hypothetical protein ACFWNK_35785 [Streptomyces sp. NPDC058417]|uniref:hypothetical protein n=1 Tax=unclassified Streptomyces TaxID=2593676 RepID=UPI00365BAACC
MTRRPRLRLTAPTATAAAALLLAGCGGGDEGAGGSGKDDRIAGAETGVSASVSASPSPDRDSGRPEITFPSDAKNVFEDAKTGDPVKDAVLADNARSVNAIDEAIFAGNTDTEALGFYNTGKALSASITFARGYIDDNVTWVGVTRYFDRKATLSGDDGAYVRYCSDEAKSYIKDRKTGRVDRSPGTDSAYVLYSAKLVKNAQGVWQTTDIVSNRGDKECEQ